jgi:hypothetical protein
VLPSDAATGRDERRFLGHNSKLLQRYRGIINLNNGGVSPSPRIVTDALVRYIWQQEDATAYTMWQIRAAVGNHSHRPGRVVRL